jgi:2-methylisocitrate lyase-like PEP mutase family enzyme
MTEIRAGLRERAEALLRLHHRGRAFVLANAWDPGSAVVLERAGAEAVGTTSAGIAFAAGLPDGERLDRDAMLAVAGAIARRVRVPVSADLEGGYGRDPAEVGETVRRAVGAGIVGVNIEDAAPGGGLRPLDDQVARLAAARSAAEAEGVPVVINARTDVYWLGVGAPEERLAAATARLRAYREVGADCLFVPGRIGRDEIAALVALGAPLNILGGPGLPPVPELSALGVARVSLGSGPARAAIGSLMAVAAEVFGPGTYRVLEAAPPYAEVDALFS